MADGGEIPNKLSHGIRLAVFWIGLPFIGLLVGIERIFDEHGNRYQVIACFAGALLSIAVAVYWERLLPRRWRPKPRPALGYLRHEDSELGSAIRDMAWCSAWGKWFASQSLGPLNPPNETLTMRAAAHLVQDALRHTGAPAHFI